MADMAKKQTLSKGAVALKRWREGKKLTSRAAAERCGIDVPTYSKYEHGARRPGLETATRIERGTKGEVQIPWWHA